MVPVAVVVGFAGLLLVGVRWVTAYPEREPDVTVVSVPDDQAGDADRPPLDLPDDAGPTDTDYAFVATLDDGTPIRWSSCDPIRYVVNPDGEPEEGRRLLDEAMDRVSVATGLQFQFVGETDEEYSDGRSALEGGFEGPPVPVLITWSTDSMNPNLGGGVVGWAGPNVVETGDGEGWLVSGTLDLDRDDIATLLEEPNGEGLARGVIQHELGHVVGLDHVDDPTELMYPSMNDVTDWGPGDRAGLRLLGGGPCDAPFA